MKSTGLFLKEEEVWAGMTVALCEGETLITEKKQPFVFRAFIGGIAKRGLKFYPVEELQPGPGGIICVNHRVDSWKPEVRLMPVQVFSLKKAPPNTKFAAFSNGGVITLCGDSHCEEWSHKVMVQTDERGFCEARLYHGERMRERLPRNTVLVPISEIGELAEEKKATA